MSKDDDNFDPWSGNPDNSGKTGKSTGKRAKKPAGQSSPNQEQDLEEMLRKLRDNSIFGNGRNTNGSGNGFPPANGKGLLILAVVGLLLYVVFGSFFLVETGEEAVVLRFGKYHRTVGDGLNFKFPEPFEKRYTLDVEDVREITIGKTDDESLMVTSDENIVNVAFTVQWKITDAKNFLFKIRDAESSVKTIAESAMREVIANKRISEALGEGEGRTRITEETTRIMQQMFDEYETGIKIVGVQLKPIDVPPQVVDAQIDVQNAKTEQERVKNQAEAYRNGILPKARGDAAQAIQEAEAYKQSVIAKAEGDASRFSAVYEEYKNAKDVTKKRIYLDTMQDVLKGMDKVIIESKQGVTPYLPLPELQKKAGK